MTQTAAAFIWALGLVAWFVIRLPHQRKARKTRVVETQRDTTERAVLALAGLGLFVLPVVHLGTGFAAFADYRFRPWMGWLGIVVELAFLGLFYASHKTLGRNWSISLDIRDRHRLVTDGVYRYVRHPMYSSFWLWATAQALLLPNWIAGLSGLAGVAALYFSRIDKEEALMRRRFGADYDAYSARTGRIFPRLR